MRELFLAVLVACSSCAPNVESQPYEACNLKVPSELVLAGDSVEGEFHHEGQAPCLLDRVEVHSVPEGSFKLNAVTKILQPNEPVHLTVTRTTKQLLHGWLLVVPQSGQSMVIPVRDLVALPSCFSMVTDLLEFDRVKAGCVSGVRSTTITNACDLPIRWSHDPLSSDFELEGGLDEYEVLGAQTSQTLSFRFTPPEQHSVTEEFRVDVDGHVWTATLFGQSLEPRAFEDVFFASGMQTLFNLSNHPAPGTGVQVTVDGQAVTDWQFDSAQNTIQFMAAPRANVRIAVRGDAGC